MTSISTFKLDPALFNKQLYTSILRLWFADYPTPQRGLDESKMMEWFMASSAFDTGCSSVASQALASLGPSKLQLPSFESYEADDEQHAATFAAPFTHAFAPHLPTREREEASLALILLLDQLPRNIFRGDAQAVVYSHYDRLAVAVAAAAAAQGLDRSGLVADFPVWRLWYYMPLEHSESLVKHRRFAELNEEMIARQKEIGDDKALKFLETSKMVLGQHSKPIELFGRYPWRNKYLGREDTQAEIDYVKNGGPTFGQGPDDRGKSTATE